jgi:DNA-binding response OmpR family regulator
LELITHVRAQALCSAVPIVVVSANPDPQMPTKAFEAGANAYFPKPFSPSVLRRRLEELLEETIHAN